MKAVIAAVLRTHLHRRVEHEVLVALEEIHVVARRHVGERQALAGEQLEQVPDPSRVLALGRRLHPARDRLGADRRKDLREQCEVGAVVLERELEVVAGIVAGPVLRGVGLGDPARGAIDPLRRAVAHRGLMPRCDALDPVVLDQGGIPCGPA